jgi:hypothetical protein
LLQGNPSILPWAGTRYGHSGVFEFFDLIFQTVNFGSFVPVFNITQGTACTVFLEETSYSKATNQSYTIGVVHRLTVDIDNGY